MTAPRDGRITSMPAYPNTTLGGAELFLIVSPGNAQAGINYNITTNLLSQLMLSFLTLAPNIQTASATYTALLTDNVILYNRTVSVGTATLQLPLASTRLASLPLVIKDIQGNAGTAVINVLGSGAETIDGLGTYPINSPYGGIKIVPLAAGGWYVSP